MNRLPFTILIYDADGKEHKCGPVWLDIPEQTGEGMAPHWDQLCKEEQAAGEDVRANLQCSLDFTAVLAPL